MILQTRMVSDQFLYTNTSQVVPFGPLLNVSSSTLCLSMYLMMCRNCSFYIYKDIDNDKEIVFEEHGANNVNDIFKFILYFRKRNDLNLFNFRVRYRQNGNTLKLLSKISQKTLYNYM